MKRVWLVFVMCSLPMAMGCTSGGGVGISIRAQANQSTVQVSLDLFIDQAKKAGCAETCNRIFLIDQSMVFWERRGNCPDFSYYRALCGATPQVVLCENMDSIAGPQFKYHDESRRALFDTILANLDKTDLGLGPGHTVTPVPF